MDIDWRDLCRVRNLRVEGDRVEVRLSSDRHQVVTVEDAGDCYRLQSLIARKAVVYKDANMPVLAWKRNRSTLLVGFRIDHRGRLVGEARVPKPGLTADEFQTYLHAVATESDRFEYLLTGKDEE